MTTRGKAHHGDALGVETVVFRMGAHPADGALHVRQLGGVVVTLAAEAIVQDEGGYALGVEPLRRLVPLVVLGQAPVASARTDDHGGTTVSLLPLGRV